MFRPSNDAKKRAIAARKTKNAGGWTTKPLRLRPADFEVVYRRLDGLQDPLIDHYHTNHRVIKRWCEEVNLDVIKRHASTRVSEATKAEFDPTKDGALLRQAVAALTLTSRPLTNPQ